MLSNIQYFVLTLNIEEKRHQSKFLYVLFFVLTNIFLWHFKLKIAKERKIDVKIKNELFNLLECKQIFLTVHLKQYQSIYQKKKFLLHCKDHSKLNYSIK